MSYMTDEIRVHMIQSVSPNAQFEYSCLTSQDFQILAFVGILHMESTTSSIFIKEQNIMKLDLG